MADETFREERGGGHPDPEIREEPGLNKIFFLPFGSQFGLKVDPLDPPLTDVRLESS